MATHLTGRYSLVELLPFSFNGFLAAKGLNTQEIITAKDKGLITGYFEQYFTCGGFPDIIAGESRYPYISSLFNVMDEKQEIPVDGKTIEVVPVTEWLISKR